MNSTYGNNLKLTIFGTSHGPHVGMRLEGIPAGLPIDTQALQDFLDRRAPGREDWSTARKESDIPHFLSGLTAGVTDGQTIEAVIFNEDVRKEDYADLRNIPRPGHADFTAWMKYGLDFDMSGGGPFSGRMTAPLCVAGGLCKQWLLDRGIQIHAWINHIGGIHEAFFEPSVTEPNADIRALIERVQLAGDSVGGSVICIVDGLPAGLGGPMFAGAEGRLASILYSIPAVKVVGFGASDEFPYLLGSECNDAFHVVDGKVQTVTNNCGGILGGITTGMPLVFDVTFKPTPSISKPQKSVDLRTMEEVTIEVKGRHDPCIVPRALPVVEAAAAIAIFDMILDEL